MCSFTGAGVSHDSGLGGSTDKIPSSPDAQQRSRMESAGKQCMYILGMGFIVFLSLCLMHSSTWSCSMLHNFETLKNCILVDD